MKRVVITGIGIISSIGNNKEEVLTSLQNSKSGIVYKQELKDKGFRSCVNGAINIDTSSIIDRRELRFMGQAAAYAQIAMMQAVADSGLDKDKVSNDRTGLLVGSGGASNSDIVESYDILKKSGSTKRLGPYRVPRTMSSATSACLATNFAV